MYSSKICTFELALWSRYGRRYGSRCRTLASRTRSPRSNYYFLLISATKAYAKQATIFRAQTILLFFRNLSGHSVRVRFEDSSGPSIARSKTFLLPHKMGTTRVDTGYSVAWCLFFVFFNPNLLTRKRRVQPKFCYELSAVSRSFEKSSSRAASLSDSRSGDTSFNIAEAPRSIRVLPKHIVVLLPRFFYYVLIYSLNSLIC